MFCCFFFYVSMSDKLVLLKKRLQTYSYRTDILYFQLVSRRMNSRLKFILNDRGEFHLNDCVWSMRGAVEGPDTCYCYKAIETPEEFFERRIKNPSKDAIIDNTTDFKQSPLEADKEENEKEFYVCRVLDSENVSKWYEEYKKITHALQFQVQVRELNKQNEIDAVYNTGSGEFHLTDCIRSVNCDLGPDTCHCAKAMQNPWKYLETTYHYIDLKKVIEVIKQHKIPVRY